MKCFYIYICLDIWALHEAKWFQNETNRHIQTTKIAITTILTKKVIDFSATLVSDKTRKTNNKTNFCTKRRRFDICLFGEFIISQHWLPINNKCAVWMFKRKSGAEQWVSYVFSVVFVKNCNIVLYEIPKMIQEIGMNPISLWIKLLKFIVE